MLVSLKAGRSPAFVFQRLDIAEGQAPEVEQQNNAAKAII
jgi:hypothetical protein